jgi:membrane protease YdiL (CAAX protease family)
MEQVNSIRPKGNRIVNILIFIGLMILVSSPTMFAGSIIYLASNNENIWKVIVITIIGIIFTLLVMWLFRWYYQKRSYEQNQYHFELRDILINIAWFIGIRLAVVIFSAIMKAIYNKTSSANDKILMNQLKELQHINISTVIALLFFLIVIIFVAPYLEELLFRGIFKETIFKNTAFLLPLIVSSLIFSSLHASTNVISFIMYMVMGLCFYMAYNRRKNIKDSMMVHMINNAVAGITMVIMIFT